MEAAATLPERQPELEQEIAAALDDGEVQRMQDLIEVEQQIVRVCRMHRDRLPRCIRDLLDRHEELERGAA